MDTGKLIGVDILLLHVHVLLGDQIPLVPQGEELKIMAAPRQQPPSQQLSYAPQQEQRQTNVIIAQVLINMYMYVHIIILVMYIALAQFDGSSLST